MAVMDVTKISYFYLLAGIDMQYTNFLQQVLLFSSLTPAELAAVSNCLQPQAYEKNTTIFIEGEPAENLFIIVYGKIKVFKLSSGGRVQVLKIFSAGDSFAEAAMFKHAVYPAFATTMQKTLLLKFARSDLLKLIAKNPQLALNMLGVLAGRLKGLAKAISELTLKDTSARFATYLLHTSKTNANVLTFKLDYSVTNLAELLNTSRENLSRLISKWGRQKIITLVGKQINILNLPKIIDFAQGKEKG